MRQLELADKKTQQNLFKSYKNPTVHMQFPLRIKLYATHTTLKFPCKNIIFFLFSNYNKIITNHQNDYTLYVLNCTDSAREEIEQRNKSYSHILCLDTFCQFSSLLKLLFLRFYCYFSWFFCILNTESSFLLFTFEHER